VSTSIPTAELHPESALRPAPGVPFLGRYDVLGVPVVVETNVAEALERVEETYGAFRQDVVHRADILALQLLRLEGGAVFLVGDSAGYRQGWNDQASALVDLFGRIVFGVLERLHRRGVYAIHAGAVVYRGGALVIAGKSGQGKTTLVLGLLRRGLGLLSDEFAVVEPDTQRILPYRRGSHIRPGTPELIPELAFVRDRPRRQLGGGIEWALTPADLARVFPGCLAQEAPLRHVLLLDGAPRLDRAPSIAAVPAALTTIELLRGTWAASIDFADGLARIGSLMNGVRCGRLRAGALDATLDRVTSWLESADG